MSLPPFTPEEHPTPLNHQEQEETSEGPRPLNRRDLLTFGGITAGLLGGFWLSGFIPQWFQKAEADARAKEVASAQASASSHAAERAKYESSPTPTQKYYSGGSKAPEGEYRAADYEGPAQNVPKPKYPEGMDIETPEGLYKFLQYWTDLHNYAMQTGDVEKLAPRISKNYDAETSFAQSVYALYKNNQWNIGGLRNIYIDKNTLEADNNHIYYIYGRIITSKCITIDKKNNTATPYDYESSNKLALRIVAVFHNDGYWCIVATEPVETELVREY